MKLNAKLLRADNYGGKATFAHFEVLEDKASDALFAVFEKVLSLDSTATLSVHRAYERGHLGGFEGSYSDICSLKADWPLINETLGDYPLDAECRFEWEKDTVMLDYSITAKRLQVSSVICDTETFPDWE